MAVGNSHLPQFKAGCGGFSHYTKLVAYRERKIPVFVAKELLRSAADLNDSSVNQLSIDSKVNVDSV